MTAAEKAERDGIDLEAANKRLAAMGMHTANVDEQRKAGIYVDTRMESPADTPAAAPKPARAKAVKGLCVHCGKNWSRHHLTADGAFCSKEGGYVDDMNKFTLTPAPAPTASPAPAVPGALTEAQANTVRALCIARWTAEQDYAHAECALMDADKERTRSEKALHDYLRSLTAK